MFNITGEIGRIDPLLNGYVPTLLSFSGTSLNGTVMRQYHGLSKHPLYRRWKRIKSRCYNPNTWDYKYYGGRGIKVCDEWVNDFQAFYDYVMALPNAMEEGMTIDRIKTYQDYKPGNIQWETMHVQTAKRPRRITNTSGYTGLKKHDRPSPWQATIMVYGKCISLGYHKSPELAVAARNDYILKNNLTEYEPQ